MNILMLTESDYPLDIRVKQEAELLTSNGHNVSVIAVKYKGETYYEKSNGVKVYRIPKIELFKKIIKNSKNNVLIEFFRKTLSFLTVLIGYSFEYMYFTFACFFFSIILIPLKRINVIHTHNPPDTLFIVASFYKIFYGIRFIFDHHDLSPDLFVEKYSNKIKLIYRILLLFERLSCKTADIIIATNESYKQVEIDRCRVIPKKIYIVRNGPDLNKMKIMEPIEGIRDQGKTVLCYIGAINIQDGVQYLLVMLAKLVYKYRLNDVLLLIIGDGDYLSNVKKLAMELRLKDNIIFTGLVKEREKVCRYLSSADIFVDAAPSSFLNERSTFIKHMEYMVFGKPIVSFALKESMFSLKDAGLFITPNNTDKMAKKIIELLNNKDLQEKLGRNARKKVIEFSWEKVSQSLLDLYQQLQSEVHG